MGRVAPSRLFMPLASAAQAESETMKLLRDAIKAVGVGVKGSKPIPEELVDPLTKVRPATVGPLLWHVASLALFSHPGGDLSVPRRALSRMGIG